MTSKLGVVRVGGPLGSYAVGFGEELAVVGYTRLSAAKQLLLMAHLSRWLAGQGLDGQDLDEARVESYLDSRRAAGYTHWLSVRGMGPLLRYLRRLGASPDPVQVALTPVELLLGEYRDYLVRERGLAAITVVSREYVARLFLTDRARASGGQLRLEDLVAAEVVTFVMAQARDRGVGSAKTLVTGLRSLLRFLHVSGRASWPLWSAVPAVAGWRGASLPRALTADQVQRLLAGCDRQRPVGRRDFAILMLLSRLGLRACEVAGMGLDDIDWRAGELLITGKARRTERLPLPVDVGEAIVEYLRDGRPPALDRGLFRKARAPHGAVSTDVVQTVVRNACVRASMSPVGSHRLRHTVATQLLAAGAGLGEIAQVLRHRDLSTTAIYAKVDRAVLRELAQPWPGTPA